MISMQALCVYMHLHVHFNYTFHHMKLLVKFIYGNFLLFSSLSFSNPIWGVWASTCSQRFSTSFGFLANMSTIWQGTAVWKMGTNKQSSTTTVIVPLIRGKYLENSNLVKITHIIWYHYHDKWSIIILMSWF